MGFASRVRSIRIEGVVSRDKMWEHGTNDEIYGEVSSVDMRDMIVLERGWGLLTWARRG